MTGASLRFLAFSALVILLANLSRRFAWRQTVLLAANAAFLWECAAGESLLPLIAFVGYGYGGLKLLEARRARAIAPILVGSLLIYIWLKEYAFLPSALLLRSPYSTIGLSYILFRIIHLLVDARSGALGGRVGLVSYLTYTLNFTTLVAGPIQRYQDFDKGTRTAGRPSIIHIGEGLERIIVGCFKANVLGLAFAILKTDAARQVAGAASWGDRVLAGAALVASCPILLYCNFSGYIDIVIGIAGLIGFVLPENFDRPFSASSFIAFWGRWHITLSTWLKTYVYNPLLMLLMRRYPADTLVPVWGVLAYFVTFFLVGAWHGRTSAFLFFGVLQGLGMSMNKLYEIALVASLGRKRAKTLTSNGSYVAICRGLTFTWFALTLLWFWFDWAQVAGLATAMGGLATIGALLLILTASTLGLALWEVGRTALWSIEWRQQPVLGSRYVRTAWCTLLGLIAAMMFVFGQRAPEIVYKAF